MSDIESLQIAGRWVRPELIVEPSAVRVRVGIQVEEPGELLGDAIAVTLRAGAETLAAVSAPDPGVPLPCASTGATYAWAEFVFANPRGLVPTAIALTLGEPTVTFDLADVTPSAPPPPPPPPVSLSFPVLRPDDLVNLRFDTVNLALDTRDPQQPLLVHADAEQEALLIVRFAPQTIVEEAFFESGGTEQKIDPGEARQNAPTIATTPSEPGKLAARIGEETRLVFRVPSGASIRYSVAGVLDWSQLELVVAPVAGVTPGATPPTGALAIRAPGPTETTLQLPYRLHLSPARDVVWDHAGAAVVHGGRAELWHTRLATPTPAGGIPPFDEQHTVALRAIWSPDYTTGPLPSPADLQPLGRLAAMSGYDRHQIVVLTSAFRGFAADEFRAYVPMPVTASLLMLSALGGWLRSFGKWEPPYRIVEGPWRDAIASEDLIRVITAAVSHREQRRLAPPEPRPDAAPRAEAIAPAEQIANASARVRDELTLARGRDSIEIGMLRIPRYELGQQLDLSQWAHIAAQGRDHYVRIVYEGRLKELGHRASLVKVTERRFETGPTGQAPVAYLRQYMYIVVREPEKNYDNEDLAHDGRGMLLKRVRLTTLVTPHIDYPYPDPQNPTNDPNTTPYNPAAITDRSFWIMVGQQDFKFHAIGIDVHGNAVDFTKSLVFVPNSEQNLAAVHTAFNAPANRQRRAAAVPGQKVTFAPAGPGNDNTTLAVVALNFENEGPTKATFFKPRLFAATVRIPAVEALTGANTVSTIRLAREYREKGFGDPANLTGAFAEIVKQDAAGELQSAAVGVGVNAAQAGGFATPNLDLTTLTRAAGPLGGTLTQALSNQFDPAQVFKPGLASLFGVFDLADLLPTGDADKHAPRMQITRDGTTVVTALDWESPVKAPPTPSVVVEFLRNDDTRLTVHAVQRKDLAGNAADSSTLTGNLNHFSIRFFSVLQVNFASFDFASKSDSKTDVNVALNDASPVEFQGDLEFVEGLRKLIPPGVFGDGVSIDLLQNPLGVHAGLTIGLPPAGVGVFALKNIAFSAGLTIPFLDGKPVVDFGFARRDNPFLLAVALLGGGGFFHIELDTDGIRMLEAAFEFGAVAALDIGVASGEVHIMAGIYFKMEKQLVATVGKEMMVSSLTGYLRCGGRLSVLGIVTVSVEFYLGFKYKPALQKATGTATLTVEIEIACFSKSIELTVERSFGSKGGDPTFGDMMETPELWAEYGAAYA